MAFRFFIAGAGLFILESRPSPLGSSIRLGTIFAHVANFALISRATGVASRLQGWSRVACCVTGALTWGIANELHQASLPGRSALWTGLAADAAGGIASTAVLNFAQVLGLRQFRRR